MDFPNLDEKTVAEQLGVARGTVKRWKQTNKVPKQYHADISKLLGHTVHYSDYSYAEKDQFFTPKAIAEYCYRKVCEIVKPDKDTLFVEPSAGNGVFFDLLPKERRVGLDIEPRHPEVETKDFLDYTPDKNKKVVVIGNPPFGLRGNLALRFINHAYSFADYVAFILPPLFDSDGKGSPMKRVMYSLIHTEKLPSTTFTDPDNRPVKVETVFQIFAKNTTTPKEKKVQKNEPFKVYSLSDGGTPATTRNKSKLNACHLYLPSTCFGKDNMRAYGSFEELPNRRGYGVIFKEAPKGRLQSEAQVQNICWADVSFLSTNSAYNLRQSLIYKTITNVLSGNYQQNRIALQPPGDTI